MSMVQKGNNKRKTFEEEVDEIYKLEEGLKTKKIKLDTSYLICPITKQIYNRPVLADDGRIYETHAITEYFKNNNCKSPLTREPISSELQDCFHIKQLVDEFLNEYPEYKKLQFMSDVYTNFNYNKRKIYGYIDNKQFEKLKEFKEYVLSDENGRYTFITKLLRGIDQANVLTDILKHVLSNCIDISVPINDKTPFDHIIELDSPELIKYMLDLGCEISNEQRHKLIKYREFSYLIENMTKEEFNDSFWSMDICEENLNIIFEKFLNEFGLEQLVTYGFIKKVMECMNYYDICRFFNKVIDRTKEEIERTEYKFPDNIKKHYSDFPEETIGGIIGKVHTNDQLTNEQKKDVVKKIIKMYYDELYILS